MSIRVYYGCECDLCGGETLAEATEADLEGGYGEREALRDTGYTVRTVTFEETGEAWELDLCSFCERLREAGEVTGEELLSVCRKEAERRDEAARCGVPPEERTGEGAEGVPQPAREPDPRPCPAG